MSYVCISISSTLAGLPGLPGTLCRSSPALLAYLLCFSNREIGNTQAGLGPTKVPQPGVDLIHMAASVRFLPMSVSTAECEVSSLSSRVLEWNCGGGIAIKEAWKEWNPAKKVLNQSNVEGSLRNWGGLLKLSDSVRLHSASELQVKVPQGTGKNQVQRYVIR